MVKGNGEKVRRRKFRGKVVTLLKVGEEFERMMMIIIIDREERGKNLWGGDYFFDEGKCRGEFL